jgi:chromosome partitioning protein
VNQKGGVGKTTIAFNLAHGFAREGKKVLVVDNDAQGNLTSSMLPRGVKPESFTADLYEGRVSTLQAVADRIYLMAGNDGLEAAQYGDESVALFSTVIGRIQQKGVLDFILIDCSPQLTNLALAGIMAADRLLIPLQPSKFAVDGLKKLLLEVKRMKVTGATKATVLGFVMNLVSPTKLHRQTVLQLKKKYPQYVFENVIHKRTAFEESPIKAQSIWDYGQDERAEIEMSALVREVLKKMEG